MTVTADNQLVVDAYNANPTSMAAALQNFCHIKVAHKMAILGDMRELGEASLQEHTKILESLFRSDFEQVWLVGEEFQKAVNHAPCTSHIEFRTFSNVEEVKTALAANKPKGYTILIKGSNSMKLVQAVECL
jgi:UDP-N-acetylmuramoyl-tripeptide--D-alanyl-D-alanine ligase